MELILSEFFSDMTAFYLITGFLGSGKTTLLKHILNNWGETAKIAVVQNEFAPSGMDGKELQSTGADFELLEINNGSVFCACQVGSFVSALQHLVEHQQPDIIFLEATGLADPINLTEVLQDKQLAGRIALKGSICVVDAINLERSLHLLPRVTHQIRVADLVLVNKMDLVDQTLETISERIRGINPFAIIKGTSYCQFPLEELVALQVNEKELTGNPNPVFVMNRPNVNAVVFRTQKKIRFERLLDFLHDIQNRCYRMKGYVNLVDKTVVAVQSTFNQLEHTNVRNYLGPTELIFFGENLQAGALKKQFDTYL
jgi:G3E family GTPase